MIGPLGYVELHGDYVLVRPLGGTVERVELPAAEMPADRLAEALAAILRARFGAARLGPARLMPGGTWHEVRRALPAPASVGAAVRAYMDGRGLLW